MASKGVQLSILLVLVMMLCDGATAQSGCTSVLTGLAPCLNYVTGNSSTPSSSCCSQLSSVVQSHPQCLCLLVNGGSSIGISINQTLALSLPGACNVQTPPVSRCNGANGPTTFPVSPPADTDTPEDSPPLPSIPAGSGSKMVPTASGTSETSIKRLQFHLTLFLIFIAFRF